MTTALPAAGSRDRFEGDGDAFESLIAGLLADAGDGQEDALDRRVVDTLRRVGAVFEIDHASLITWPPDASRCVLKHSWTPPDGASVPRMIPVDEVPWLHRHSVAGEVVTYSTLDELPREAARDREFFREAEFQSVAAIPLRVGDEDATLLLASRREEKFWPWDAVSRLKLLADVFRDLFDRRRRRSQHEKQVKFERLLALISAGFVNLAPEELDNAIEQTLQVLCEHLDLDRSSVFQMTDEAPQALLLTHLHNIPEGTQTQKRPAPAPLRTCYWASTTSPPEFHAVDARSFPWIYERIRRNETVKIHRMDDLPPEAAADRSLFARYGTRSTVVVPMCVGSRWLGCLTFATTSRERTWTDADLRHFHFVTNLLGNCLLHRRTIDALAENEQRMQLAAESAGVGLWSLRLDPLEIWANDQAREIFHFAPDEDLKPEKLLGRIHPEDADAVRKSVREALDSDKPLHLDCRIVLPDGRTRWVVARARPDRSGSGSRTLIGAAIDITERKENETSLKRALEELRRLQDQLNNENALLRKQVQSRQGETNLVGGSARLQKVVRNAEHVARTDSTVLILGETGTGKELVARHVHRSSKRANKPFVVLNIAAIPTTLLESELFGREKGAFTGALTKELGRFEMANGGTLFLDEIGEMPLETQAKLLRVLQSGEFERLGSGKPLRVDVRVLAATNRNLPELIKAGQFREDLYYRLNVFPITVPPLRDRLEDLPQLVWAFVRELSEKMGRAFVTIRDKDLAALKSYGWPGNVRELRNVVERSMILSEGTELRLLLPDATGVHPGRSSRRLMDVQKEHVLEVIESTGHKIHGPGGAAQVLGLKPSTLYSLMTRLGIPRKS